MPEQFTVPRWIVLLARETRRGVGRAFAATPPRVAVSGRKRRRCTAGEPMDGPFWDPVVHVPDPWRRCSDPLLDPVWQAAIEARPPRLVRTWAGQERYHDGLSASRLDGLHQIGLSGDGASEDQAGPPLRVATLTTLTSPAQTDAANDNGLTRQLLAAARATPMAWPRVAASAGESHNADLAPTDVAGRDHCAPATVELQPEIFEPTALDEPKRILADVEARLDSPDRPPVRMTRADDDIADELIPSEAPLDGPHEPTESTADTIERTQGVSLDAGSVASAAGETGAQQAAPSDPPSPDAPPMPEATAAAPEAVGTVAPVVALPAMDLDPIEQATGDEQAPAVEYEPAVTHQAPKPQAAAPRAATALRSAAATVLAPAVLDEYNRIGVDFRRPMPRPKVRGLVIDFHCHLLARRHAEDWFEAADHYGMGGFVTMSPLEEAVALARDWGHRLRFIAVPQWGDASASWADKWLTRIESFYNLGSRIAKFHASPGTMAMRGHTLDSPAYQPLLAEVKARGMAIMTHVGDPDTWYHGRYDPAQTGNTFGDREDHYRMWEALLEEHRGATWIGAHMGGNPENLPRLQRLLDKFPDLWLDCSATRWMVREISARREPAREFFIRNADRILFGSDQVSGDDRHFDFLASRIWCHRKLWETAYIGPSPIIDPDLPPDQQPTMHGLALPDAVLQKIYHDNPTKLLAKIGMGFM